MQNSQLGKLLVASTVTNHPIYAGGVCLIVHEDDEHTIGVMLNRPLQPNIAAMTELMNAAAQDAVDKDAADKVAADEDATDDQELLSDAGSDESLEDDMNQWSETDWEPEEDDWSAENFEAPDSFEDNADENSGGSNRIASKFDLEGALETDSTGMTPLGQLHFGGPVSGPVVALHGSSEHAEMETGAGIYVAAHKDHLEQLVREQSERFRLIVGHLRWSPGALESEIEAGLWHPLPATPDEVFAPAAGMWPRLVRRATSRSMAGWIGTTDLVDAASWN